MKKKPVISFTVFGNPVTKKNHSQIVYSKNRHFLIPSKPYMSYANVFKIFCAKEKVTNLNLSKSYILQCKYFMQTKRRVDITNLLAATCDLLVTNNVIIDDNSSIISSLDGSRVFYDKENPRVEIALFEA